jgi:hypothetical protein
MHDVERVYKKKALTISNRGEKALYLAVDRDLGPLESY